MWKPSREELWGLIYSLGFGVVVFGLVKHVHGNPNGLYIAIAGFLVMIGALFKGR
jgi:hypothetical protein